MGVQAVQLSTSGIIPNTTGLGNNLSQQLPVQIYIETSDTLAAVLGKTGGQPSYLNKSKTDFQFPYTNQQMALVYTTDQGAVWLSVVVSAISGGGYNYGLQGTTNVSTTYEAANGSAAAPSYTFVSDTGTGFYYTASHNLNVALNGAQAAQFTTSGFSVSTGAITASAGALVSGAAAGGQVGTLTLYPTTASKGYLAIEAVANAANSDTVVIQNASFGQGTVLTIPDPGNANGVIPTAATATPFTAGNLVGSSSTTVLEDSGITISSVSALVSSGILKTSGTLTSGNLTGMYATPVAISQLPAVAGMAYVIHMVLLEYIFVTTAYATDAGSAYLTYGSSAHAATGLATAGIACTGLFDQAASTSSAAAGAMAGIANTGLTDVAIYISNTNAALSGSGADGTAKYTIWYSLVAL